MTPYQSISQTLTGDTLQNLRRQLEHPPMPHDELVDLVEAHRERVREANAANPLVNVILSDQLADALIVLLGRLHDESSPELRNLVQAAVLYYAETDDGDDDLETAYGFDDDLAVVQAVQHRIDAM